MALPTPNALGALLMASAAPLLLPADPNYPVILAYYVNQASILLTAVAAATVLPGTFANGSGPVTGIGGPLL